MKLKYIKENLEPIVKNSKNWAEVLRTLSMTTTGNSRKTLKGYVELHKIDISHFETKKERYKRVNGKLGKIRRIPLKEILIENSTYHKGHLKDRLYKEGLKIRECELCGQDEEWRNKKMSLILDHKNGVNNDNRIENLRIVCPNCNATLDTHCGKNKYLEIRERKEEEKRKKYIEYKKSTRKNERPSYNQLMMEIRIFGYNATGRKYNVSDNTIRKWKKFYEKYEN